MTRGLLFFSQRTIALVAFSLLSALAVAQAPVAEPAAPGLAPPPADNIFAAPLPTPAVDSSSPFADPSALPIAEPAPIPTLAPPTPNVEDVGSQTELATQRQVKELQEEIRKLFSESQFEATIDKCEELLRIEPQNATALILRERAQKYLVSSTVPPTPVQSAEIVQTPVPAMDTNPATSGAPDTAGQTPGANNTSAPPAVVPTSKSGIPMLAIPIGGLVLLLIIVGVVFMIVMKRRAIVVPVIPKATASPAAGMGLGAMSYGSTAVTQPGYFELDGGLSSQVPTQPAPFYDEKTSVEARSNDSISAEDRIFPASEYMTDDAHENEPTRAIPVTDIQAAAADQELEVMSSAGASSVDIAIDSLMSPDVVEPEMQAPAAPAAPSFAPKAPAPLRPKPPVPSAVDIAAVLPPMESLPSDSSESLSGPPSSYDIAPPSLFGSPNAEQTASANPNALSFNSLMFGNDETQTPAAAANAGDDVTMNTFNKEYSTLMFGSASDETKMPPPAPPTADAPHSDQVVIHDETSDDDPNAITTIGSMMPQADKAPAPPGAPKISMFDRQKAGGTAALAAEDYPKAVHCLSIAASLKPADKEVREMLEEARAKRAAK